MRKGLIITSIVLITAILEFYILRINLTPNKLYVWESNLLIFLNNFSLSRLRFIIASIISFGVPGIISIYYLFKIKFNIFNNKILLILYSGLFVSILMCIFAAFVAVLDGRPIWISYPYICLISGFYLESLINKDNPRKASTVEALSQKTIQDAK